MKKVVSVLLAVLMLCSLTLVAFAATMRFSVIDDVSASATTTRIQGTLGNSAAGKFKNYRTDYKYSSAADDYMRSVKFTETATNRDFLMLVEDYNLKVNDKVVFTFTRRRRNPYRNLLRFLTS